MLSASILVIDERDGDLSSRVDVSHGEYAVTTSSADEAFALVQRESVAVVLASARVAERDDYALVRRLSSCVRARLPILVVGEVADIVAAYHAGAIDVVSPDVPDGVLRAKIELSRELHRERRRMEDANRRLLALMEAAPVGLAYSVDELGQVVHGNATLGSQFELDPQDNVSASAPEPDAAGRQVGYFQDGRAVAPDDLPLQRARAEDRPTHAEVEVRNATGREWIAEMYGAPVHDKEGALVGAVAITVDVTGRKQIDRELRASEHRFRELADSVPHLVWTAAASGAVDYFNSRRAEYAGITQLPDGMWRWDTVVHPDDVERTITAWRTAVEQNDVYVCEHRIKMADGTYRWHLSRARPVRDEATGATRWFGTATDMHETKEIEARLRANEARLVEALDDAQRAMKARDRLASAVSHDLRNPLSTIVTQAGLLRTQARGCPDAERFEQGFRRIERNAAKMTRMLDELLDAARLAAGEPLELDHSPVALRDVCEQVARDHQAGAPGHRIAVIERAAALGEWDRTRIERVVDNLVSNAVKYSPQGGVVELEIDRDGTDAVLRVRDEGVGIAPDEQDDVFRWFGRGEGVKGVRGTGIGLAGSRQIAEQHGGSLRVESERGKGAVFTLRLPTERVPQPTSADAPRAHTNRPRARDEEDLLAALLRVNLVGFAVSDTSTGRCVFANRKLEQLTGYTQSELRERTFSQITHPDDRAADRAKWLALIGGQIREVSAEKRYVRKDGRVTWVLVNGAPIWQDGRVVRTVAVVQDITEFKESERRLAEALRIREEFLGAASHELRTPLAALVLQLGMLRRVLERAGEDGKPCLAKVAGAERSSARLSALVDDLLDVSRFTKEPLQLHRERVDLAAVVTEVVDRMGVDATRAGCAIETSLEPAWGYWDRARMDQVVRHLVENALRFGERKPITVSLQARQGVVELRVVDHGAGIDASDRGRLFLPEREGSSVYCGGLGLGLHVVKRVVEAHGGTIDVASPPGRGTEFAVRFPREAFASPEPRTAAAEAWH